ncbi:TonB-dependent receptor domain-containing protein [Aquimarina brevivitae]|uniref:TonB-dependent receptor-like beta-barrel domain-containing protein n=1 Tax=Aquimarina brevivitae TaxID=323412 RepID=A0A4Q7NXD2_9FLAO|nr:TonB-dependent receptor [Aquimarina brevivitae]RZS91884.1 hypothetical protein EV197_2987 [Aquimarina brevivitae]
MQKKCKQAVWLVCIFLTSHSVLAQDKDQEDKNIGTEKVMIVKAYTPTIQDASKIKTNPKIEDSITQQKKAVQYSIFSVPVASTFTPAKGRAASIDRPKKATIYDNYATLGFGNYTSVLGEFYSNFELNRTDNAGVFLHHNSSQGGIDDVALENKFYQTYLDLNYTSRARKYTYGIGVNVSHQLFNWYGLPEEPELTAEQIAAIDPEQSYFGAGLTAKVKFDDAIFKEGEISYNYFGDAYNSIQHHAVVSPTLHLEIGEELITTNIIVDYLSGSFERDLNQSLQIPNEYGFLNLGVNPNVSILRDNLRLNLGASIYFSLDTENSESDVFIYPNVTASYQLLDDMVIAYAGIEGELKQNTYEQAVEENPFVSPTLFIAPTNKQYDAYLGLKGKISDLVNYKVKASYTAEEGKPLFVNNRPEVIQLQDFDYGNSYSYRYDTVERLGVYGELNFEINKTFTLGINGTYASYTTDNEAEAWNLPEVTATLMLNYQIDDNWSVGAQTFYVGERMDIDSTEAPTPSNPDPSITLDSYMDANISVRYRFSDQLSVFVKGNNLLGNNYERWVNFPVQGIQVLGGLTYKFNY